MRQHIYRENLMRSLLMEAQHSTKPSESARIFLRHYEAGSPPFREGRCNGRITGTSWRALRHLRLGLGPKRLSGHE